MNIFKNNQFSSIFYLCSTTWLKSIIPKRCVFKFVKGYKNISLLEFGSNINFLKFQILFLFKYVPYNLLKKICKTKFNIYFKHAGDLGNIITDSNGGDYCLLKINFNFN